MMLPKIAFQAPVLLAAGLLAACSHAPVSTPQTSGSNPPASAVIAPPDPNRNEDSATGFDWSRSMAKQFDLFDHALASTEARVMRTPGDRIKLALRGDASFTTGQTAIQLTFKPVLNRIAQVLQAYPDTHVLIVGHTDSTGSLAANQALSQARAQSVRNYLLSQGIDPKRLTVVGKGPTEPVASNDTPEGRDENRRVELLIGETKPPAP